MRSGARAHAAAHLANRAERAEAGVSGHPEHRGCDAPLPEAQGHVQLGHVDDPLALRRVRVRVSGERGPCMGDGTGVGATASHSEPGTCTVLIFRTPS
jgi:hypothetical protein